MNEEAALWCSLDPDSSSSLRVHPDCKAPTGKTIGHVFGSHKITMPYARIELRLMKNKKTGTAPKNFGASISRIDICRSKKAYRFQNFLRYSHVCTLRGFDEPTRSIAQSSIKVHCYPLWLRPSRGYLP